MSHPLRFEKAVWLLGNSAGVAEVWLSFATLNNEIEGNFAHF
jgi:hypothetical protein